VNTFVILSTAFCGIPQKHFLQPINLWTLSWNSIHMF